MDYFIKSAIVQLLDDDNACFLQYKFSNMRVVETFYNNESRKSDVKVHTVEVIN